MNRLLTASLGGAAVVAVTWLWHAPLGAGERLAAGVEARARAQLDRDEMRLVTARVQRQPLSRRLILSGPADDFQRSEIARRMEALPGAGDAVWDPRSRNMEAVR